MDLNALKQEYRIKQIPFVLILIVLSFLSMIWMIVLNAINPTELSNIHMVISIVIFSFVLTAWLVVMIYQMEKNYFKQIHFLYGKFALAHNMNHNHAYSVKPVTDVPREMFKKFPLYKYTIIKYELYMVDQANHHQLLYVSFNQNTGKSNYVKSSGLLYVYPKTSVKHPDDLILDERLSPYAKKLQTVEFNQHYFIYLENKEKVKIYRRFKDKEKEKVETYAKSVFEFFDRMSDLF